MVRLPQVPGTNWADPRSSRPSAPSRAPSSSPTTPTRTSSSPSPRTRPCSATPRRPRRTSRATSVAQYYQDFLNKPEALNNGPHHQRVLDGGLRRPVRRAADRVRAVPDARASRYEYGMEFQPSALPARRELHRDIRKDAGHAWRAAVGDTANQFDFVFYLSAGQDESSTWQEFGEMKFGDQGERARHVRPAEPRPAQLRGHPVRAVDVVGVGREHLAERAGGSSVAGRKLRAVDLRPRVQPHPRHRRQLQQPVRRAAARRLQRAVGHAVARHVQRARRPAHPLADPGDARAARWAPSTSCATSSSSASWTRPTCCAWTGRRWPTSGPVSADVTAREAEAQPRGVTGVNITLTGRRQAPGVRPSKRPVLRRRRLQQLHRRGRGPDGRGLLRARLRRAARQDEERGQRALRLGDRRQPAGHRHDRLHAAGRHAGARSRSATTASSTTRCSTRAPSSGSSTSTWTRPTGCTSRSPTSQRDRKGILSYTVAVASLDGAGPNRRGVGCSRPWVSRQERT